MYIKEVSLAPSLPPFKPWDAPDICVDRLARSVLDAGRETAAFTDRRPNLMGRNVNVCCMTNRGCSQENLNAKLRDAVKEGDKNKARKLMDEGANPFAQVQGKIPTLYLVRDLEMALILTRFEGAKAFAKCQNIDDFWGIIFPHVQSATYNAFPKWMPKVPFFDFGVTFNLCGDRYAIADGLEERLPDPSMANILKLLNTAPFFRSLWEKAGEPQIVEVPDDYFAGVGNPDYTKGTGAAFNSSENIIRINQKASLDRKIFYLIFELLNAVQKERFAKIEQLAMAGDLSREDYVLLVERIEFETQIWQQKILQLFGYNFFKIEANFSDFWKAVNTPFVVGGVCHAAAYREHWELNYMTAYLQKIAKNLRKS
jgi:hypothetical protein